MSQAQFKKELVLKAASKIATDYRTVFIKSLENKLECREKAIIDEMKPRWWRRARSRERAEQIVLISSTYSYNPTCMMLIIRAEAIMRMAELADGDCVTLTVKDAEFIFG